MSQHILLFSDLRSVDKELKDRGHRLTLMVTTDRLTGMVGIGMLTAEDLRRYNRIVTFPADAAISEWSQVAGLLHQLDPFDRIGGFHELVQDKAAIVANALGLHFHPLEVVYATWHKDVMRARLREAGVDPTESRKVAAAGDIEAFADTYGYPLILKPINGRASIGVSIIRGPTDIAQAIAWFQESGWQSEMLVEQYLEGEELSVEAFSEGGTHRIVSITQKYKERMHCIEVGHCIPAPIEMAKADVINRIVPRALSALGVANGPTHTEVILTRDGPRIIETHLRLGGDCIPDLVKLATGVDLTDLWIQQTLGASVLEQLPQQPPRKAFAAIWYIMPTRLGIIKEVTGVAEARAMPGVVDVEIEFLPGREVTGLRHSFSRLAYAIATGQSEQEAVSRAQAATEQIQFITEG